MPRLFADQLEILRATYPDAGGRAVGMMRQAINTAYQTIGSLHHWNYLRRRTQITTNAKYATGTISTSGTTVTLASGTWPTWAASAQLIVGNNVYRAATRTSGTVLVLQSDRYPVTAIAAGTAYTLVQTEYLLPTNWVRMERMVQTGTMWETTFVPPEESLELATLLWTSTRPWRYTIRGAQYGPTGRRAIEFLPPPDSEYTFDIVYEAKPNPRAAPVEYSTGTISVSTTAVTGVGTAFTSAMIGRYLRVGSASALPTGIIGDNPVYTEYKITAVGSATTLTLESAADTATTVKYLIDDVMDIEQGSMLELFDRLCDSVFENMAKLDTRVAARQLMIDSLRLAMADDRPNGREPSGGVGGTDRYSMVAAQHSTPRAT